MSRYLLSRLLQALLLLWLVSMIAFAILHLAPGGPLSQFLATGTLGPEDIERLMAQYGLDRPLPLQYLDWAGNLLRGDWGRSYRDDLPVLTKIGMHVGPTLELMISSTLLAMFIGGMIGILGAVRRYSIFDHLATIGAMVALSIPTFWFGLAVIYVFSVNLGWLPAGGRETIGDGSALDRIQHLMLPCIVLALVSTAVWSRYMRSSMLDVINQDYIRTARSKGVAPVRILIHHALRNALLPMITITGLHVSTLLSGALVTETVFTWPGMGRLFLDSVGNRDYPVVMGMLMFTACMVLLGSLLADLLYSVADPRIKVGVQ
ncbi:peptide/nickel transport system permease protein [Variovorax sp. SG517]|uniref:ABC transporter permease n=1 Tax=Variovorax sp. SG517 TaxID=2587117 RepID=UPI00159E4E33|nr:ABC transporter permease [Variovorax sp. SG517]NVM92947.1 peptide/nickel transport system permease protein [Variovorax sp. SG517]